MPSAPRTTVVITLPEEAFISLKVLAAKHGIGVSPFVSRALAFCSPLAQAPIAYEPRVNGPVRGLSLDLSPTLHADLKHAAKARHLSVKKWLTMFCDRLVTDNWSPPPSE